jgi:hypothetical protein
VSVMRSILVEITDVNDKGHENIAVESAIPNQPARMSAARA